MTAIIDYGVGNLFSLRSSLQSLGETITVTSSADELRAADRMILPGVGAFEDARNKLKQSGLDEVILEETAKGKPLLGICLGMQMLFENSFEYGVHPGLGLLAGSVVPMKGYIPGDLKIPHIGWNALRFTRKNELFKYIQDGDFVYFVHSYFAAGCDDSLIAAADYGRELTAAVSKGNIYGCQFHPEKSGKVGLNILRAFCELEAAR